VTLADRSGRRALICSPTIPEFDRESGSRRLFDFVEFLRDAGWAVTFATRQAAEGSRYVTALQQRGVETFTGLGRPLDDAIGTGRFDLALLAFWYVAEQCLPTIRRLSPHTRVVVDSVDLHFVRNSRRLMRASGDPQTPGRLDDAYGSETVRELNAYAAADAVLAVSDRETELIDDLAGGPRLAYTVGDCEDLEPSPVPFAERRGILFVGNFRHPPNVEAVEYLLGEVVPRLDPSLLAEHPLYVVGNALEEKLGGLASPPPNVHLVGWVPSVLPYLHRAAVTVVPLLHGAGTKRKVLQALLVGTPTVSTSIGVEGLPVRDDEQVLVADDPARFAASIGRLLSDQKVWERIAEQGRAAARVRHGREAVRERFAQVVAEVLSRRPKLGRSDEGSQRSVEDGYGRLVRRAREVVDAHLPADACVIVVSKGDPALLELAGRTAWHFPRMSDGQYAGHNPADGAAAISHLEELRAQGGQYLLLPATALWWLDHYAEFRQHLEGRYSLLLRQDDTALIFDLRSSAESSLPTGDARMSTTMAAPIYG
jgi:glycosyltransferase involved in cell wall biosynthesis